MPPLASLAASLLVASPPPAACGPPCLSRQRRRKPSLPSAYPQPTLSLPSNPFPSRSRRRRRRRGCRRWRAWRRVCSSPRRPRRPVAPHASLGNGGGSPAYPQPILSPPSTYPLMPSHPARGDGGLAASLLVASPPLAACGPHAASGDGGRGPACPQPILSLPSAYPLILSYPARGDGGGGDAAADELDGDFARGISAAPGGLRSPMPLEATQAEALHTCRTVYSLILSCRLVALLLLAVRVMASGAKKSSQAQERRCQEERRRKDLRPRYAECERQQSAP